MQCPSCNVVVPEGAAFCAQCGAALEGVCRSCNTANAPGSRFCRTCGSPLGPPSEVVPVLSGAVYCPRCHNANEAGAAFCYSCGLPFDEQTARAASTLAFGRPAGFWIRVVAAIIDAIVLTVVNLVLVAVWPSVSISEYIQSEDWGAIDAAGLAIGVIYSTVGVAVFAATIGKHILGIRVLRPDGSKAGPVRAFFRYFAGGLSALLLCVGYLMVAFRQDKRGLHDLICDTVVVYR